LVLEAVYQPRRPIHDRLQLEGDILDPPVMPTPSPKPVPKPTPIPVPTPTPAAVSPVGITDPTLKLVWRDEFDAAWPDLGNWRQGEREKADGHFKAPGSTDGSPLAKSSSGQDCRWGPARQTAHQARSAWRSCA
jgi:hypothetical protein